MYKIPNFDSEVDYFRTIRGMDTDGNLIAYCKLPEEEEVSVDEPTLTESEHDDIMFHRYVS